MNETSEHRSILWRASLPYQFLVLPVPELSIISLKGDVLNWWFNLRKVLLTILFLLVASTSLKLVRADQGMIPITPGVSVYEPGQKAIVAWDGHTEILILSTDVSSSQETLVLQILPVPSKPEVEAASFQSFETIQNMIWEEALNRNMYSSEQNARAGSVEVLFQERIGAHNITVVQANNAVDLGNWANAFLSGSGVDQNTTLQNFQTVVQDYMGRGFRFYVLDLVTLIPEERSTDAVMYRFNSSTLYYPLLITSPVGGNGKITLFTLTKEKPQGDYGLLQPAYYQTTQTAWQQIQFTLSTGELAKTDLRLSELLPDGAWLTVLTYQGDLSQTTKDLMLTQEDFNASASPPANITITLPVDTIAFFFLLGTAFALTGAALGFLFSRLTSKKWPTSWDRNATSKKTRASSKL
jgi:hypothetical protein